MPYGEGDNVKRKKTEIKQPAEEERIQDYHTEYKSGLERGYTLWVSVVSETKRDISLN